MNTLSQTFDLLPLRFYFAAAQPIDFANGGAANLLRGTLGKELMRIAPDAYARWFSPELTSSSGPSGLRNQPRPFVIRASHLDGVAVAAGEPFHFGVNMFETRELMADLFAQAFEGRFGRVERIEGREVLQLPLEGECAGVECIRVRFLTPTELKSVDLDRGRPEFGKLFARMRDRISMLRTLYGAGPLDIDFKAIGERAAQVHMTNCEIQHVDAPERLSGRTGQHHSLGGFAGMAEYQGDLDEFLPYLEIARWTGVGRQTVWGKGEIGWEAI
jgi:hypothetical protein